MLIGVPQQNDLDEQVLLLFSPAAVLLSGIYDLKPIQLCYVNDPLQLTE